MESTKILNLKSSEDITRDIMIAILLEDGVILDKKPESLNGMISDEWLKKIQPEVVKVLKKGISIDEDLIKCLAEGIYSPDNYNEIENLDKIIEQYTDDNYGLIIEDEDIEDIDKNQMDEYLPKD